MKRNSADLGGLYPPWPSASVDITLLDLQNSSSPTQPRSVIAKYIFQISTSALQSLLRVMKTLNARTVTARLVACVNKGSPETEKYVKVLNQFFKLALLYFV